MGTLNNELHKYYKHLNDIRYITRGGRSSGKSRMELIENITMSVYISLLLKGSCTSIITKGLGVYYSVDINGNITKIDLKEISDSIKEEIEWVVQWEVERVLWYIMGI